MISKPLPVYLDYSTEDLQAELSKLEEDIAAFKAKNLALSMARGKPGPEIIALDKAMLDSLNSSSDLTDSGVDCSNYGCLEGIESARRFMAELLEVEPDLCIVQGQSSLELMSLSMMHALLFGFGGASPLKDLMSPFKVICPVPGYDRHFALAERLGAQLIPVAITAEDGLDIDAVEELLKDPMVKALWLVPKYSNPTGISLSDQACRRLAQIKPAASDFRIYWDNAYIEHHLYDDPNMQDRLPNMYELMKAAGNEDHILMFTSSSKMSFAGSGIAAMAASRANLEEILNTLSFITVGPDKINQLRHVRYFKTIEQLREKMMKRAQILRPKFELVDRILSQELGELQLASWTKPKGGYFISCELYPHTAKNCVQLAQDCGVSFTPAGACFPGGFDPLDSQLRIAPSFPSLEELDLALRVFCNCVKYSSVKKILEERAEG